MLQTINQTNMKLKMIPCSNCGQPMPELRLLKAGFSYCVTCSENGLGAGRKQGIPVMMGEGDHTWIDTVIMDDISINSIYIKKRLKRSLKKQIRLKCWIWIKRIKTYTVQLQ